MDRRAPDEDHRRIRRPAPDRRTDSGIRRLLFGPLSDRVSGDFGSAGQHLAHRFAVVDATPGLRATRLRATCAEDLPSSFATAATASAPFHAARRPSAPAPFERLRFVAGQAVANQPLPQAALDAGQPAGLARRTARYRQNYGCGLED